MEIWREVWRVGVAPTLSDQELAALKTGLEMDDPNLIQGATTVPPPIIALGHLPCSGGCAISYAGWKGDGLDTVEKVENFFAEICYKAGQTIDCGVRPFLNFFDEMPRTQVFNLLLSEVNYEIEKRLNEITKNNNSI